MVALAAKRFEVPFYVAAPLSTFDRENSIYDVEIEERIPQRSCIMAAAGSRHRAPGP